MGSRRGLELSRGCLVNGQEGFEERFEEIEAEGVGAVRFGLGGVVVDFEEEAVDAGGDGGFGEGGDELRLAA